MRIEPLADHPWAIGLVVRALQREWPAWAAARGEETVYADVRGAAGPGALPQALVAIEAERVLGTITLAPESYDLEPPVSPWIASLLVQPELRGRGLGAALIRACMVQAGRFGYAEAWTATATAVTLFERCGWRVREHILYRGEPLALMHVRV